MYIPQHNTETFSQNLEPGWNNIQTILTTLRHALAMILVLNSSWYMDCWECQEPCIEDEELIFHRSGFFEPTVLPSYFSGPYFSIFLPSTVSCLTINVLSSSCFNLAQAIFYPSVSLWLFSTLHFSFPFPSNFFYSF